MLNEVRYAIRGLRRSPLFASVAILSLALGIGANTSIFSLMDQILLRKLAVVEPDRLVMIHQEAINKGGGELGPRMNSYPLFTDLQQKAEPFEDVLCRRVVAVSLGVGRDTERVSAEVFSGNYFSMLGVKPALGRVFNREDDKVEGGSPSVVLSHAYWVSRFGADPGVLGTTIRVNDYPLTVVGVSAEGFVGLDPTQAPQIRVPVQMKEQVMATPGWLKMGDRRSRWLHVFARLKPGYTVESAQPALQTLYTQIRAYEMTLDAAKNWSAYDRAEFMKGRLLLTSAAIGYSGIRNDFSAGLVVLMGMVGLVLVIACANVGNLLIARGLMRQKEIALRLSLGATRSQLVRQLLVESLVLSFAGGLLGLGIAFYLTRALLALIPEQTQPLLISPLPDLRILVFTFALTLVTGTLLGLLPALRAGGHDPWTALKDTVGAISGTGGSLFLRKGLVAAQVALSFLLLFGAGLFVNSLQNLKTTKTGVELENLVTFQLSPALSGYDDERATLFYRNLKEHLASLPGVQSASLAEQPILAGDEWDATMAVEGHHAKDGEDMQAFMNAVSPGYFQTLKTPIIEGRDFNDADARKDAGSENVRGVAIVNRRFAEHFFPGQSAIGKHLGFGEGPDTKLPIEIVGLTTDSLYEGPREGMRRQVFIPNWGKHSAAFYVRVTRPSNGAFTMVRDEVRRMDASVPVYGLKTVEGQLDETLLTDRLMAMLSTGFGVLATLLATIGLYGVMAFVVVRRRKELGIRLALGARPGSVTGLVMREVLALLAIGLAVGVPTALGLSRYISSQLYGVQAHDPRIALTTVALLGIVSAAAGFIPARRASRIDPIVALRYE